MLGGDEAKLHPFFHESTHPVWVKPRRTGKPSSSANERRESGKLREDVENELWVWKPILRNMCTVSEVKSGTVTCEDLLKLNALIEMTDYLNMPPEK